MMNAIIIVGTDTDIGKTVFAAALTDALGGIYWKPIQAGIEPSSDSDTVAALAELPADRVVKERYRLSLPASPHLAAEHDGVTIDVESLTLPRCDKPLIVETAGGLLVPLTRQIVQIDIIARWRTPVILCARTALGTINHSLLSIEALKRRAIPILGVAFIGDANEDSEAIICQLGGVRRLGRLPILSPLDAGTLRDAFRAHFNVAGLLGVGGAGP
jgi:dethiobiotin synthetase